jgi:hypothetical protein
VRVAGFSFVRNAQKYDYPVVESIRSILPLCDAFYIAVGTSDDDTLQLVEGIGDPKIHILHTVWDDSLREGGTVLALETDKAFQAIPTDYDWCFYIQADEIVHEDDYIAIRNAMQTYLHQPKAHGLLFNYKHFYGSYNHIGTSRNWYRKEIRIIRNDKQIHSYRDAQGFRWVDNRKLQVQQIPASIYHYGWVKSPEQQQLKQKSFHKLWHDDAWVERQVGATDTYTYNGKQPLARFEDTHPLVMHPRVARMHWTFEAQSIAGSLTLREKILAAIERWTGYRIGEYKNYRLL